MEFAIEALKDKLDDLITDISQSDNSEPELRRQVRIVCRELTQLTGKQFDPDEYFEFYLGG